MFFKAIKQIYRFSHDPYHILGVDKTTSFNEIKKAYYKMAAQYHPDINKTPSAEKQFILIKESFEKIKQMKGEAVQMNSEGSGKKEEYESVRKNYKDYDENFNETDNKQTDFKEFYHQTEGLGNEYDAMRKSFQNIHEVKDIKFKPIDMKMPDASRRFHLGQVMFLKTFSDGSNMYIITVSVGMFIFFFLINSLFNRNTKRMANEQMIQLLNKQVIVEELPDEQKLEQLTTQIEKTDEFKAYQIMKNIQQEKTSSRRKQLVPEIQNFISASDLNDSVL